MAWRVSKPEDDGRAWTFGVHLPDGGEAIVKDEKKMKLLKEFGYDVKPVPRRSKSNDD